MTLTIQTVTDCDAGTYACYVFSVGDFYETYSVKVTVEDKGCETNTFGTNCSQTCGRCAGNQTCNTTTGHCPDCLDGWTPPLCTDAVPEEAEPLLTPNQQIVVGVTVGAPLSWAFIATLIQICQVLGNAGWLPFLHVGGKDEEGKEKGVDDDESSDTGPPSKCSRFLRCILCGGAGVCLLSFLFCVSCGKLMSSRFTWDKKEVDQDAAELKRRHSSLADAGTTEKQVEVVSPWEGSTDSSDATTRHLPQANTSPDNQNELFDPQEARKQSYPKGIVNAEHTRTSKFTDRYFSTLSWLESPFEDPAIARSTSTTATNMHGFYSSGFQIKKATYNRDDDANKSDQKADDQAQTVPQVKQTVDEVQNANDDRQRRDDDS
ncbi:uncharacterized protein [Littorina saxatilis]|uniref:Uncharacterized protein n=1 Tax=Littorina saxatilis TaxID=31220 RepID=A0AAN9BJ40_9CAEN